MIEYRQGRDYIMDDNGIAEQLLSRIGQLTVNYEIQLVQLRQEYEARIGTLQERVNGLESRVED